MAEQDQFGPPGNLSSPEGGSYVDDVKMAFSKFYDNYMDRSLTETEEKEVQRISLQFNVQPQNIDLVKHYVVGQRYRGALGVGIGFGTEAVDGLMYSAYNQNYASGFSPDDAFATSYGSMGYSPSQVASVGGFSHTESREEMAKNMSNNQGFFGKNLSKFGQLASMGSISPFGININAYIDSNIQDMMDLNFSNKGLLGNKNADPRGGGT